MFFTFLLRRILKKGTLRLMTGSGIQTFGQGAPAVSVRLRGWQPGFLLTLRPDLKIARAYGEGRMTIEQGSLRDLRYILFANYEDARKEPLFKTLETLAGHRNRETQIELIKRIYGFLPEAKCRQVRRGKKWPARARALFSKPWHRLFHIRHSWSGLRLLRPRRRARLATPVTLSLTQYRAYRPYGGALKQLPFHLKKHKKAMASLFDQHFPGHPHFHLAGPIVPLHRRAMRIIHIRLKTGDQIVPWTRDHIHQWGKSICARSDHFVRQETS